MGVYRLHEVATAKIRPGKSREAAEWCREKWMMALHGPFGKQSWLLRPEAARVHCGQS